MCIITQANTLVDAQGRTIQFFLTRYRQWSDNSGEALKFTTREDANIFLRLWKHSGLGMNIITIN